LLAALLGLVFLFQKNREMQWVPISIYLTSIYICLVYIATQADPRYSFPLRPELYICATYFMCNLVRYLKTMNSPVNALDSG